MTYAPVVNLDTARRRLIAERLLAMGVPLEQITATQSDTELQDLWTRERTARSLQRLTGHHRTFFGCWDTGDMVELEKRCLAQLMGCDRRNIDGLIYSIGGRQPRTRRQRTAQKLKAWDVVA